MVAWAVILPTAGAARADDKGDGSGRDGQKPPPITLGIPSGQSLSLLLDPLGISGQSGLRDTPLNEIPDFSIDLFLFQCGSSLNSDGTLWCGTRGKPDTGTRPEDPGPGKDEPDKNGPGKDGPDHHGPDAPSDPDAGDEPTPSTPSSAPTTPAAPTSPRAETPASPGTHRAGHRPRKPRERNHQRPHHTTTANPMPASDSGPDHDLLVLAAAGLTLMAAVGRRGIAVASTRTWRRRFPRVDDGTEGEVIAPDEEMYEFDPHNGGPGDRSRIWGIVSGWVVLDRFSRFTPFRLAKRVPLVARVLADAPYLRAILGAGSLVLSLAAFVLGLVAAHDTGGLPLAPSYGLVVALLLIACLDAAAGFATVVGFGLGVLLWGPGDLGFGPSLRSFLGLSALWFAIPLIASSVRPLRRTVESRPLYVWDRLADGVIGALVGGWAVQSAVDGLAGLSGFASPISAHADALALWAMGGILARVGFEEVAARLFPERLKVVDSGMLPEAGTVRNVLSAALRVAIFLLVVGAFIGNCWQLWVAGLLAAVPEVLDFFVDRFPNSTGLYTVWPRGVTLILAVLVVELFVAGWAEDSFTGHDALADVFVVMMIPAMVFDLLALFGREGPEPGRRRLYEALGVVVVAASVYVALIS